MVNEKLFGHVNPQLYDEKWPFRMHNPTIQEPLYYFRRLLPHTWRFLNKRKTTVLK